MSLINSGISSGQIYPPGYRVFLIGENIELVHGATTEYLKIENTNPVPFIEKYNYSNWILAAGSSYNAGDISDFLEPANNELLILAFSILCDVNMNVKIKFPGSVQRFGTKKSTDVSITPEISPWKEPSVTLHSWGTTYVPAFVIENPTEYKNLTLKFGFSGFRYQCKVLPEKPEKFTTINLDIVQS